MTEQTATQATALKVESVKRSYQDSHRIRWAATRVYVSINHDTDVPMEQPAYSVKGESPELDRAWRRYNKLEVKAMADRLEAARAQIAELVGTSEFTYRFSRKAGCSCGCSAGFIVNRTLTVDHEPVDLYVSVAK